MARKKIIPEEEVPETAVVDETEVTDTGEAVQSGPPPNADALGAGVEAPIARGTGRKTAKKAAGEELPTESGEEITAEETPDAADEDLAGADDSALSESSAISAALESVLDAYIEGAERSAADTDLSDVNMTPGRLPELHEATSELPSYSIDLSEEPEAVPAKNDTLPDAEEDDWGFREPRREVPEEEAPAQPTSIVLPVRPAPSVPSVQSGRTKAAVKSDRQLFFELKFNELDRGLTPEERQEWNSIYASYRGRSALTGTIIGVDPRSIYVWNPKTERREKLTMYCAIVVPYRVRIMIPETEMWEEGEERPDYVLQNMVGAKIDFIIIKVEREAGFAVGSRRLASRSQRYFFAHREDLHSIGARVKCQLMAVGPRRCRAECYGHDIDLTQREISYTAIPDLRNKYHAGVVLDCIVKVYDPKKDELIISIKEIETNPFLGAEQRHPVGCRRLAVISGKYGGGVFCNLPDGVVCMCNYSYQHEDSDFMVGENVMLVVQRYDDEKLQVFGKIMSKW